jgi:hypothetical protein
MNRMQWQVGDWVRVTRVQGRSKEKRDVEGRIVYIGRRYAVVELEQGYRESFWLEELRPITDETSDIERAVQERLLAWSDG